VITRATRIKVFVFLLVSLLGTSFVAIRYVGLGESLFGRGYTVYADFANAGGIFVNAPVTYRGVPVGRVTAVTLHGGGARARLRLDDGVRVPADLRAVVAQRSAVGEQYLDLRPDGDDGPFLADGAVIPRDRTAIPIPVEQLLLDVDRLAGSIDEEDLRIVVDELGRAFAGAGDDLGRLIDNGDLLLARAEESLPQTLKLITDGQTVLDTQRDSRSAIREWARELRRVTDTLVELDPELRQLVVDAPDAGAALQRLVDDAGPGLGGLVRNLDILNRVQLPRTDGIRQMLITYPDVISGGFTVVRRDEDGALRSHFGFVPNAGDPHSCTSGYVPTIATPGEGAVASVDTDRVRCQVVDGRDPQPGDGYDESGSNIRGEQNIGRNGGVGSPGGPGLPDGGSAPDLGAVADEVLGGLLGATPFSTVTG